MSGQLQDAIVELPIAICVYDRSGRLVGFNKTLLKLWGREPGLRRLPDEYYDFLLERVLRTGRAEWNRDLVIERPDGSQTNTRVSAVPLRNKKGRTLGVFTWFSDKVEGRKPGRELLENTSGWKPLEDRFRQTRKMETIGRLAAGIAHDFNNLLVIILGQCHFALKTSDPDTAIFARLQEIKNAAERGKWLTAQLLIFGRQTAVKSQVISLNAAVKGLREMLDRLIRENIRVVTDLDPMLGHARADFGLIQQAILNLALNAQDAMPTGGTLTITATNVEVNELSADHPGVPAGRYVTVAVGDSGTGMDAATKACLFEPFFTTKAPGQGTGLGLVVVQSVVGHSGGYVGVESEINHGSTFSIYLPRIRGPVQPEAGQKAEGYDLTGSETVLLVEDAGGVRSVIRDLLIGAGYSVLEAGNGLDAVQIMLRHPGSIHLLLTDLVMPGISGQDLAKQAALLRPAVKALFISGYAAKTKIRRIKSEENAPFLQKPFAPQDLFWAVRQALDS